MALTSILTKRKDDTPLRLQFITTQYDEGTLVQVYECTEEWIPFGQPKYVERSETEETFHKSLRKEATEKGEYDSRYSTNPEWNPGAEEENGSEN